MLKNVLGFVPEFDNCNSHIQVNEYGCIFRDKHEIWTPNSDGNRNVKTIINGHVYSLPAYRIVALSNLVDCSKITEIEYRYLCALIFKKEKSRSIFAAHHVNGNHNDNAPHNLVILHKADHKIAHRILKKRVVPALFNGDEREIAEAREYYLDFIKFCSDYKKIAKRYSYLMQY